MKLYDIAVIGAGAAGAVAAIRAGQLGKNTLLAERNDSIGKKILLTGKGRCNVTNASGIDTFIDKFGKQGNFLKRAFLTFSNEDLMRFFESKGLRLKIERQARVFPETDKSVSVTDVLMQYLVENRVDIVYNMRLKDILAGKGVFQLSFETGIFSAKKVILATGGKSYTKTGSSGDGFDIASRLGHDIIPLRPALVPLRTKEAWVKELQGLSLKNVRVVFECGRKKIRSDIGECIFTHFGVSGPLVLDLSGEVVDLLREHKQARLLIDLKPGLDLIQLNNRLLRDFEANGGSKLKNIMKGLLPNKLILVFMRVAGLDAEKKVNQITQKERAALIALLKGLPLTVTGALSLEEGMVTAGGISTKQIHPDTMESRIVPGLYFAGEMICGAAPSGGYNLQKAFSTGYLAGESAAICLK